MGVLGRRHDEGGVEAKLSIAWVPGNRVADGIYVSEDTRSLRIGHCR